MNDRNLKQMKDGTRRLAAIMFTDIVGYTSLMGSDEKAAMSSIDRHKQALESNCATYSGEVIDYYGDGSLSVFGSVYDALRCALNIQQQLRHNVPLRIGIHIGEILQKGDDIFGDGVNVASRVESAGIEGTVLLSSFAYDKVKNQSEFDFLNLGAFQLKNVAAPVTLYALKHPDLADPGSLIRSESKSSISLTQRFVLIVLLAVIGVIGILVVRGISNRSLTDEVETGESANGQLNSVAVFPFEVQGTDELAYLGEGLVDLFSTKIDGIAGLNAVDPNITIAKAAALEGRRLDTETSAQLAREVGASEFIIGNVLTLGDQLRIKISEYSVDGTQLNNAEVVVNSQSELLDAVDELVLETLAQRYSIVRQDMIASSILMSENLGAVKAFLRGEEFRRGGYFEEASQSYVEATNFDSTMCMAWLRMGQMCAWSDVCPYSTTKIYQNARRYKSTLPPKMRDYVELSTSGRLIWQPDGPEKVRALLDRYGENVDFLFLYGEALFHSNVSRGVSAMEALDPMMEAYSYDLSNTEILTHIVQLLVYSENSDELRRLAQNVPGNSKFWPVLHTAWYITRPEGWSNAEVEEVLNHPGFDFQAIFLYCRSDARAAEFLAFASDLQELHGKELERRTVPVYALMNFWQGREKEGREYMRRDKFFEAMALYGMPLLSWRPEGPYVDDILNELNVRLTSGNTGGIYPDDFPLAIYALSLGNKDQYFRHLEMLQQKVDEGEPVERYFIICQAFQFHKEGDFEESNKKITEALSLEVGVPMPVAEAFIRSELASLIAENAFGLGDIRGAVRSYEIQYEVLAGGDDNTLLYSWLRRAELYEQLNEYQQALNMVNRFLEISGSVDDKFLPWVAKAEEIRNRVFSKID